MPNSPKEVLEKMERMRNGWRTLAPTKKFGGMSLEEFEALIEECMAPRQRLLELADEERQQAALRDSRDDNFLEKAEFVVAGVLADPTEGSNSALYESFGYIRKEDRKSGLTRKKSSSEDLQT